MVRWSRVPRAELVLAVVGFAGCTAVLGIDDIEFGLPAGTGGYGAGPAGGSGGAGGAGATAGNGGTGGATSCVPDAVESCYDGPAATLDVGACHAGSHTCNAAGTGFGPCLGQVVPAVEDCALPTDDDCDGLVACSGATLAAHAYGGNGTELGQAIALDPDGNVLLAGDFSGAVDFGGNPLTSDGYDIYVAKLDAALAHLWSARFGAAGAQYAVAIGADATGAFTFTESIQGNVDFGGGVLSAPAESPYLAQLAPDGAHRFSRVFPANSASSAQALAIAPNGDVLIGGRFAGTVDFGGGNLTATSNAGDLFVARFDASGTHLASRALPLSAFGARGLTGVALDSAGNLVACGYYTGTLTLGGACGALSGTSDAFVVKLDPAGQCLWAVDFGDGNVQSAWSLAVDPADQIVVVGRFQGSLTPAPLSGPTGDLNAFVMKLASDGAVLWARGAGGNGTDHAQEVALDAAGNAVVIGTFAQSLQWTPAPPLTTAGGDDLFVAKLDPAGNAVWSRGFGGTGNDGEVASEDVAVDPLGRIYFTAAFAGTVDFGLGPLQAVAGSDIVVGVLAP
ncbi:MAG: hypothetical protein IT373_21790 [Polyangiaceae bacterium]|nr:hypothetical protein [Polyangiaceae bacterium]